MTDDQLDEMARRIVRRWHRILASLPDDDPSCVVRSTIRTMSRVDEVDY